MNSAVRCLLPVEFADHVAQKLIFVICVEAPEVGDVSLHIGEVVDDIFAVRGSIEGEFARKRVFLIEVISTDQTGHVCLQENFRVMPLQLDSSSVHPVERKIEVFRDQGTGIRALTCDSADSLKDQSSNSATIFLMSEGFRRP